MSMTTTIYCKERKQTLSFVTQQYEVGLYVALYVKGQSIPSQTTSDLNEVEFHKQVRKEAKKNGDTFKKSLSDPLNYADVRNAQVEFAIGYCNKRGWPLSNNTDKFELLSKRQIKSIQSRPGFEKCKKLLKWY